VSERCEYNPQLRCPSTDPPSRGDCPNDASVVLGANGKWHVCASCAQLPEFRRFRVRGPVGGKHPSLKPHAL
jgi:hypothetical protein